MSRSSEPLALWNWSLILRAITEFTMVRQLCCFIFIAYFFFKSVLYLCCFSNKNTTHAMTGHCVNKHCFSFSIQGTLSLKARTRGHGPLNLFPSNLIVLAKCVKEQERSLKEIHVASSNTVLSLCLVHSEIVNFENYCDFKVILLFKHVHYRKQTTRSQLSY